MTIYRCIIPIMRNVSNKSCRENKSKYFMFSNFFFENRAVYEIMSKNIVKPERPQMPIWHMRVACWIKATRSHTRPRIHACTHTRASIYVHVNAEISNIYRFPTATTVSRTRLSVTLYVHCPPLVLSQNQISLKPNLLNIKFNVNITVNSASTRIGYNAIDEEVSVVCITWNFP
jgi:hypothetical protein